MMRRILIPLVAILLATQVLAQIQGKDVQSNLNDLALGNAMFRSFDNRFKGIEGYPTLYKQYFPGEILLVSGVKVIHDSINLDVYNNDLLVKRNNLETVVNKAMVAGFSLSLPEQGKYFTKLKDLDGMISYFEVLVKGKVKLFKRTIKTIEGPTQTGAYSNGRTYSIFEEKVKLFIQVEDGDVFELKNKKEFTEKFPGKEGTILKHIKENRINLKNESEWASLIEFINTQL